MVDFKRCRAGFGGAALGPLLPAVERLVVQTQGPGDVYPSLAGLSPLQLHIGADGDGDAAAHMPAQLFDAVAGMTRLHWLSLQMHRQDLQLLSDLLAPPCLSRLFLSLPKTTDPPSTWPKFSHVMSHVSGLTSLLSLEVYVPYVGLDNGCMRSFATHLPRRVRRLFIYMPWLLFDDMAEFALAAERTDRLHLGVCQEDPEEELPPFLTQRFASFSVFDERHICSGYWLREWHT